MRWLAHYHKMIKNIGGRLMKNIRYIGMDVHKEKIMVAESKRKGEATIIGEYPNRKASIKKMIKKFREIENQNELRICYEAGPCGYAIKRILDKEGLDCQVVAPSLIPIKVGNKIKNDKKDAQKLARYYRAGELTFIMVPEEEKEAVRDMVRCRQDLVESIRRYKQRIGHFLLKRGTVHKGKSNWTKEYREWAKKLQFGNEKYVVILTQYMSTLELLEMQRDEITAKIEEVANSPEYKEQVAALNCYRGISTITAMTVIAEIVDFKRFKTAKELMAYLGLVPSEYSSGNKETKGSITKCGNKRVRQALVETAWHYVKKPIITAKMRTNLELVPSEQRLAPVKALKRLHKRYYHLVFAGKLKQKAVVAVARELSGFIWHTMVNLDGIQRDFKGESPNYSLETSACGARADKFIQGSLTLKPLSKFTRSG